MESVGDVFVVLSASMFDQYDQYFYWNHYSTDCAPGTLRTQKTTVIITIHIRSTGCTSLTGRLSGPHLLLTPEKVMVNSSPCLSHTHIPVIFYVLVCAICPDRISFTSASAVLVACQKWLVGNMSSAVASVNCDAYSTEPCWGTHVLPQYRCAMFLQHRHLAFERNGCLRVRASVSDIHN